MDALGAYIVIFMAGILAGFVLRYTIGRIAREKREQDAVYHARRLFARFVMMAPSLVIHMRMDLARPEWTRCRRFTILPSRDVPLPAWVRDTLVYFESEHLDLRERVAFLKQVGFVEEMPPTPAPVFVMTEVFVALMYEASP